MLWRASKAAVAAGYPIKSVNLTALEGNEKALRDRCERLQREMLEWCNGGRRGKVIEFDGTFRSILDMYENDPKSPFHELKEGTRLPYIVYLRMMRAHIGRCHIDRTDGRDVQDWFREWSKPEMTGGPPMLAKANMAISALKSALAFAIVCRKPGCLEFRACIPKRLKQPPPRRVYVTASSVEAVRKAAHALNQPGAALAYALQFEGPMRQWDVIGIWVPLSDPRPSAVHRDGRKWIGPTWADLDQNLILRWKPSKTEHTSGKEIAVDFRACPMVMAEIETAVLSGPLSGPLIVDSRTGLPYHRKRFERIWRAVAGAAGIPAGIWNRDLRKSGSTEARRAGAAIDDVKKVMGHTAETDVTANVYDLATLEAFRRVSAARLAFREGEK